MKSQRGTRKGRGGGRGARKGGDGGSRSSLQHNSAGLLPSGHVCSVCYDDEPPTCAVGVCGHAASCAACALRLRILYGNKACPLCKASMDEVILLPARLCRRMGAAELAPKFVAWRDGGRKDARLGPGVVCVATDGVWESDLLAMMSMRCRLCAGDSGGADVDHGSLRELKRHLNSVHKQHMCKLCLDARPAFPMERELFSTPKLLATHVDKEHPVCKFCKMRFYNNDALHLHMQSMHEPCGCCARLGSPHVYLPNGIALQEHLRDEHFPCSEPVCLELGGFVAFATREDLQDHVSDVHGGGLSRWNRRAGVVRMEDWILEGGGASAGGADRAGRAGDRALPEGQRNGQTGRRRGQVSDRNRTPEIGGHEEFLLPTHSATTGAGRPRWAVDRSGNINDFPPLHAGHSAAVPEARAPRVQTGVGQINEESGRQVVIDDDAERARSAVRERAAAQFPSLPSGGPRVAPAAGEWRVACRDQAAAQPPPNRAQLPCSCGRRTGMPGEPAPQCDTECEASLRRRRLAEAFGIRNSDSRASGASFSSLGPSGSDASLFTPQLLNLARSEPNFVVRVEEQLAAFCANATARRQALPVMNRARRAFCHELAGHYGLASQSYDQEPRRHVELFKPPRGPGSTTPLPGPPAVLLSRAARNPESAEEAAALGGGGDAMAWASRGNVIIFSDVKFFVDLDVVLKEFRGEYTLVHQRIEGPKGPENVAVASFSSPRVWEAAATALGAGRRGIFTCRSVGQPRPPTSPSADSPDGATPEVGYLGGNGGEGGDDGSLNPEARPLRTPPPPPLPEPLDVGNAFGALGDGESREASPAEAGEAGADEVAARASEVREGGVHAPSPAAP